jgi:acyl-CoA dehydrogenase
MDSDTDMLAELARNFFEKECAPNEQRWGRQQHVDREVWLRAGELGLLCASIPEEYGGGGGTFAHEATIALEQVRALAPSFGGMLHSGIIAHYLSGYGTEEQKRSWLPRMASGELVAAIAMTEPGTGSDLQAIRTNAVADGEDYLLNGSKTFISNGFLCDLVVVVAKTDTAAGAAGVSLIVWRRRTCRGSGGVGTWRRSASTARTPASCSSTTCGCPGRTCSAGSRGRASSS